MAKKKKVKKLLLSNKSQGKHLRDMLIATGMIVGLVLATLFFFSKKEDSPLSIVPATQSTEIHFLYPSNEQTFEKGETYRLKWVGGPKHIDALFLVDSALQKDGVSVSLADRVYNFTNKGYLDYTVPSYLPEGEYFFEMGDAKSNSFLIVSPK